jgi:hypothetical protein
MESLLRLSGLLTEDDGGKTDLGTLEKRLADRTNALNAAKSSNMFMAQAAAAQQAPSSHQTTPRMESTSSPQTAATSPESQKSETEVEALSDMMCSLVTNNCGETRYIGMLSCATVKAYFVNVLQDPHLDFPYSLQRVFNGSMRKPAIHPSKT